MSHWRCVQMSNEYMDGCLEIHWVWMSNGCQIGCLDTAWMSNQCLYVHWMYRLLFGSPVSVQISCIHLSGQVSGCLDSVQVGVQKLCIHLSEQMSRCLVSVQVGVWTSYINTYVTLQSQLVQLWPTSGPLYGLHVDQHAHILDYFI